MASEVTIPRLGWNMDEGTFVGWLKSDGQHVAAGEPLFSLEGDKATQDVESLETGTLRIPPDGPKDGDKIAVGTLIGYLVAPGEPAPFEADAARILVRCQRHCAIAGGRGSDPSRRPSAARTEPRPPGVKTRISPRARRVARELGRRRQSDWKGAAITAESSSATSVPPPTRVRAARTSSRIAGVSHRGLRIAVTPIRRTIAERMVQSAQTAAGVTLSTTVDATNLVNLAAAIQGSRRRRARSPSIALHRHRRQADGAGARQNIRS